MASTPSSETEKKEPPAPEVLKPQADGDSSAAQPESTTVGHRARHVTYRPSHKATFVGAGVIVAILAINVAVIFFVMRSNSSDSSVNREDVVLSNASLDKLGVSKTAVGDIGTELIVGPNAKFNGKVTIASDVSIAGQLRLNSKFSASDASFTKLDAGDTALGQLNVNGDGTISTLNLRKDLNVAGSTKLQGPVSISGLLTVNNSLNVAGNLAVGGILSARGFQASSLISDTTLVIGGHIITRGSAPNVGPGPGVGSNGTVSISGNDSSGTVAVNTGVGAGGGIIANVAFRSQFGTTPHVVVTAVGPGAGAVYVTRTVGGFSVGTNGPLAPGGYAFDYIVMQ